MEIVEDVAWIRYRANNSKLIEDKVGKWMYFFNDRKFVEKICKEAVEEIVCSAKHSNSRNGVACFYLNVDDIDSTMEFLTPVGCAPLAFLFELFRTVIYKSISNG